MKRYKRQLNWIHNFTGVHSIFSFPEKSKTRTIPILIEMTKELYTTFKPTFQLYRPSLKPWGQVK